MGAYWTSCTQARLGRVAKETKQDRKLCSSSSVVTFIGISKTWIPQRHRLLFARGAAVQEARKYSFPLDAAKRPPPAEPTTGKEKTRRTPRSFIRKLVEL